MSISPHFVEILEDGDLFFPLSKWPPIAKEYMLKAHKSHNERYYLMRFLTYNGLHPEQATKWILREGNYDDSALRDQHGMTKKARDVAFFANGKIFNMRYGRTDSLNDPPPPTEVWPPPPTPTQTGFTYRFEDIVKVLPIPNRKDFEDHLDYALGYTLWKAEVTAFHERMKAKGGTYVVD